MDDTETMSTASSGSDDEQTDELEKKASELELQVSSNLYHYDGHVELVKIYLQLGDLTSMRESYKRFYTTFPLTDSLWLELLKIEINLASTEEEKQSVVVLFEKATEDYLSVNLWMEFINFSLSNFKLEKTREIIEKALTSVGLHTTLGSLIWDYLRELETAQLAIHTPSSPEFLAQLVKLADVYKRQLSVPLINMESTYKEWEEMLKNLPDNHGIDTKPLEYGYKTASGLLKKYIIHENELENSDLQPEQILTIFKKYIIDVKDPSTKFCLYERAIEKCCLLTEAWHEYCNFAIKFGEIALKVTSRALRNITWDSNLWILKIRILEQNNSTYDEVLTTFEQATSFLSLENSVELWLAFLSFAKRSNQPSEKLDKLFQQALTSVGLYDSSFKILRYQAKLYAGNNDLDAARKIWKQILAAGENRTKASVWLEYANMEKQKGTVEQTRAVYERAMNACKDYPAYIAEEWSMFEIVHGTLADIFKSTEKIAKVYVAIPQSQPPATENSVNSNKRPRNSEINSPNKKQRTQEPKRREEKRERARVSPERAAKAQQPILPRENSRPSNLDMLKSVFVSNLARKVDKQCLCGMFPGATEITLALDHKTGESRCFGYVQFNTEDEATEALKRDREPLEGRPVFISKCKPPDKTANQPPQFKYSLDTESNKLFIRGLAYSTTEAGLMEVYKPHGVIAVRIVTQKSGQSKGIAYVEFGSDTEAKTALQKTDGMEIDGRCINVAISAPPKKGSAPPARDVSTEINRNQPKNRLQIPFMPRALSLAKSVPMETSDTKPDTLKKTNDDFRQLLLQKK